MNFQNPEETFATGNRIPVYPAFVSKEAIIEFASEFDPAPFHLDEEAGKESLLGGLAASGFHTCALTMRMVCESYLLKTTSQGALEVREINWLAPVRPGDTLSGETVVLDGRRSRSRPGIWIAVVLHDIFNQNHVKVTSMEVVGMFSIPETSQ